MKKCCAKHQQSIMMDWGLNLLRGYARAHHHDVSDLHAEYDVENRGHYGYAAGVTIYKGDVALSSMSLYGAMRYIILGGAV